MSREPVPRLQRGKGFALLFGLAGLGLALVSVSLADLVPLARGIMRSAPVLSLYAWDVRGFAIGVACLALGLLGFVFEFARPVQKGRRKGEPDAPARRWMAATLWLFLLFGLGGAFLGGFAGPILGGSLVRHGYQLCPPVETGARHPPLRWARDLRACPEPRDRSAATSA